MISRRSPCVPVVLRAVGCSSACACSRRRLYNSFNALLWQLKALAIMLVGVAVKLAIYNPTAPPTAHYALDQRMELGLPSTAVFLIQLFHALAIKNRHHYSVSQLTAQPAHAAVLVGRIGLLAGAIGICFAPLTPIAHLWAHAGLALLQCALSHLQDFKFPIASNNQHPMRMMPQALHALHQCRVRARDEAALAV